MHKTFVSNSTVPSWATSIAWATFQLQVGMVHVEIHLIVACFPAFYYLSGKSSLGLKPLAARYPHTREEYPDQALVFQ